MNKIHELRVAWLLPVAWFYWQPALSELAKFLPKIKIFTGLFPGFAQGFENSLDIEVVGKFKVVKTTKQSTGYGSNFTYLSPAIIKPLLQFKPDVVFSSSFGIWTILALLLKPWCKWRVIIAYEGSSPGVDYRNSAMRLLIRRIMVKWADAYITNSQAGKAYLIEILEADPDSVFAKPYEIPAPQTLLSNQDELNLASLQLKRPIFLFVGRIIPRKGLDVLLEACTILNRQGYQDYTLLIVGDGEQKEELEAKHRDRHLQNYVKWVGRVDYNQINFYYKNADVFVLPTKEDTWGVVVLEVMLFGKPVLCSTGAGTSEMIVDGENGFLFDPHQPEKLAQLMSKFIDNPHLINLMGEKSRQKMTAHTPEAAGKFLAEVVEFVDKNK